MVRTRMALDFKIEPEQMVLQRTNQPYQNFSSEYIEDFIAVTKDANAANAIQPVNIKYGSARDILNIKVINNQIHIAIKKEYQLNEGIFKYVEETKRVTYIDLDISRRIDMPEKGYYAQSVQAPVQTSGGSFTRDTIFVEQVVEKIVHDTIFVETTVEKVVEKPIFIEKGKTNLSGIKCVHYMPWWREPYFKLNILFKKGIEQLKFEPSSEKLDNTPPGYEVQYAISQEDDNALVLFDGSEVDYIRCKAKIMLMQDQNKCYILSEGGLITTPDEFEYDENTNSAALRVGYSPTSGTEASID